MPYQIPAAATNEGNHAGSDLSVLNKVGWMVAGGVVQSSIKVGFAGAMTLL